MADVIALPTRLAVDTAWDRFAALAKRAMDDPRLLIDREHQEATVRAWATFRDLYAAWWPEAPKC